MDFGNLFNLDNPIWKYLGRVWDTLCLTALFLVFSLPIVTMGASATATAYVAQKIMCDQEGHIVKQFIHSFKLNWKQSMGIWFLCALGAVLLGGNLWFYYRVDNDFARVMMLVMLVASYVLLMIIHMVFPVISRFENSWTRQLGLAFYLAMKNFGWTLLMITTTGVIIVVSIYVTQFLIPFSVGLVALIDGYVCNMIFNKYIEEQGLRES